MEKIKGMQSLKDDMNEKSGFETNPSAYMDKKGTPNGANAMLNVMPPGMDISNQPTADIRNMTLKKITPMGYEGDGGFPSRDVAE